jgi:UDP-GlcNAc:undecaprenyl-phosphate GlcNAc-1-phosphate transferase
MTETIALIITPIVTIILALLLTPLFRKLAVKINLVDKPNARKVHTQLVPLIGGIVVCVCSFLALLIQIPFSLVIDHELKILAIGSIVLLVMGIYDDKTDMRAIYKLIIQIAIAYYVFASGVRINSLFGIFGINEIPIYAQYALTIIIITGTVNAFNLTDGIDGLAAGLAIVGLSAFSIIALMLHKTNLALLFLAIIGALIGFLRFNLSAENKIFMGDAGSLVLGYILVVSGIMLIQSAEQTNNIKPTLATVIGVLSLPIIDSLRVYRKRIKNGNSPFKADKTHFHHLVLGLGVKHKSATAIILLIATSILIITIISGSLMSLTLTIIILLLTFAIISSIFELNQEVQDWLIKIKKMEEF